MSNYVDNIFKEFLTEPFSSVAITSDKAVGFEFISKGKVKMLRPVITVVLLSYFLGIATIVLSDKACDIDLDDIEEVSKAANVCLATTKFKLPESESPAALKKFLDDFEKGGFDDKCFHKCVAEKLQMVPLIFLQIIWFIFNFCILD